MSSPSPLHRLATQHFDERYKRKQSESFLSQPEQTIWVSRHRTLRTQYLHLGVFLWKQYKILASYSFCLCTPLLTLTKYFFSSIHQLKLSSSKTFVTRWSVSVMIDFPFFRSRFCQYFTYFFGFMWSSSKVFEDIKIFWIAHSRPFIRYQGKNLDWFRIWCCFRFFMHCLVQPNQNINFLLHVIFYQKDQALNYSSSQLVLFMLLKFCSLKFS